MHSVLELTFGVQQGKTVLKSQYASGAMKVVRPFEVSDYALLQIASVTPGIHNGDHYQLSVKLEAGARVILLNQSATKLHGKKAGVALHDIQLQVASDAHLEYYPGLTIPFQDAHYQQNTHVQLAAGARFGIMESWSAGRIERGELWQFETLKSTVKIDLDGTPLYRDAFEVGGVPLDGLTDGFPLWASGFWHGLPAMESRFQEGQSLMGCGMTRAGGQYFRLLGHDTLEFQRQMTDFVQQHWGSTAGIRVPFARFSSGVFL